MDDLTAKLGSYVLARDSRLACAAAVVLAEMAPRDPKLTRQLAEGLEHADGIRRPFIIEALGRIGTPEAAAALVPLIKSEGPASEQALRAIAHTASAALKPLLKMVGSVPPALLERIAECTARTGEPAAFSGLLAGLQGADVETCRAIRSGLRAAMSSFDAKARHNLLKQAAYSFEDKALTQHIPSLIALLKIAGDLRDVSLQQELAERIGAQHPAHVRRAALQAIAMLNLSGAQRAKLAPKLLPLMFERDMANLAEPALEALRQAQLGSEHYGQLRKLLNSPASRIREFAMQAMASQGTPKTIHELIACLNTPDRSVREEALGALSRTPAAAAPLCERLLQPNGGETAAELARALVPQAAKIPGRLLASLADQFVSLAGGNGQKKSSDPDSSRANAVDERRRAILSVFRAANSPELVDAAVSRARKLRNSDAHFQAYDLLKNVAGLNGWTDEYRIEMALSGLSVSPRDMSRSARSADPSLRVLEEILSSGRKQPKDLARVVLKDPALGKKLLYYLGFHFVERLQNDRQFGHLLLQNLSEGRSDEGRQAREKLMIEGLVSVKGGKPGILEERAKAMFAPPEIAAAAAPKARSAGKKIKTKIKRKT